MKEYVLAGDMEEMREYAEQGYVFLAVRPGCQIDDGYWAPAYLMERDKPPTEAEAVAQLAQEQQEYEDREAARAKAAEPPF